VLAGGGSRDLPRRVSMPTNQSSETFRMHVVRQVDTQWLAKARSGDKVAQMCVLAVSRWMKEMVAGRSSCICCDTVFSRGAVPQAFLVLIAVEQDRPENLNLRAAAVCSECSTHDDQWLMHAGARRTGLIRPRDQMQ
jgi:hypothetical protein